MVDALVRAAQRGERDAQRGLYERHHRELYVYVRAILRDRHEAEDAVQEIFARALKALPRYDQRQPVRNWLLVIARNHALDLHARGRRTRVDDPHVITALCDEESGRHDGAPAVTLELQDLIATANLSLRQRQVVALRYVLGLPAREAAEVLDSDAGLVRQAEARALKKLRRTLLAADDPASSTTESALAGLSLPGGKKGDAGAPARDAKQGIEGGLEDDAVHGRDAGGRLRGDERLACGGELG